MKTRKKLIVYFELEQDLTKRVPVSSINWSYSPQILLKSGLMRAEYYDRLPFKRAAVTASFFHEFPERTVFVTEVRELIYLLRGFGIEVEDCEVDFEAGVGLGLAYFTAKAVPKVNTTATTSRL